MDHGLKFSDRRRHNNPYCLEDFAAHALALASDRHRSAIFFDGHLLKGFQVLLDVGPLEDVTGKVQLPFKLFAEYQDQEAAKDMATNGSIPLMKDGAGVQQRFDIPKNLFHLPQLFIA